MKMQDREFPLLGLPNHPFFFFQSLVGSGPACHAWVQLIARWGCCCAAAAGCDCCECPHLCHCFLLPDVLRSFPSGTFRNRDKGTLARRDSKKNTGDGRPGVCESSTESHGPVPFSFGCQQAYFFFFLAWLSPFLGLLLRPWCSARVALKIFSRGLHLAAVRLSLSLFLFFFFHFFFSRMCHGWSSSPFLIFPLYLGFFFKA